MPHANYTLTVPDIFGREQQIDFLGNVSLRQIADEEIAVRDNDLKQVFHMEGSRSVLQGLIIEADIPVVLFGLQENRIGNIGFGFGNPRGRRDQPLNADPS